MAKGAEPEKKIDCGCEQVVTGFSEAVGSEFSEGRFCTCIIREEGVRKDTIKNVRLVETYFGEPS